jgi:hypothetical protein
MADIELEPCTHPRTTIIGTSVLACEDCEADWYGYGPFPERLVGGSFIECPRCGGAVDPDWWCVKLCDGCIEAAIETKAR